MSLLLLILVPVAAVWLLVAMRYLDLVTGVLVLLLAGTCFGHPFFHLDLGPLPLTIDRVLLGGLAVLYLLHKRFGLHDPKPLGKADLVFGLWLVVLTASTLMHDWRIDGKQPAARLLFFYLLPAIAYWIIRQAPLTAPRVRRLVGFFSVFGLYLAVTAIAEQQELWSVVFPRYIASPKFPEFFGRGRGPLLNPIGCGLFLSVCLAALGMNWPHWSRYGRAATVAGAVMLLVAVYCTLTRSVWMGAAAALVLLMALVLPKRISIAAVACTVCGGAILLAAGWDELQAFKRDEHVSAHEMANSARLRPILAAVAWQMFQDRPLWGCGLGQYREEMVYYLGDRNSELPLEMARPYVQHNTLLSLLTETGLVGTALFVIVLGLWIQDGWRLWSRRDLPLWVRQQGLLMLALLAAYLPNAMFHEMSLIPMVNMLLFVTAGTTRGLVAGWLERSEPSPVRSESPSHSCSASTMPSGPVSTRSNIR